MPFAFFKLTSRGCRSTGEELNFVLKHVQSLKQPLLAEWKNAENVLLRDRKIRLLTEIFLGSSSEELRFGV